MFHVLLTSYDDISSHQKHLHSVLKTMNENCSYYSDGVFSSLTRLHSHKGCLYCFWNSQPPKEEIDFINLYWLKFTGERVEGVHLTHDISFDTRCLPHYRDFIEDSRIKILNKAA